MRETQPEPGRYQEHDWVCPTWVRRRRVPIGVRSALPGVEPSTYRTKGLFFEHGNFDPSAGPAKPGRPTGPAGSRTKGGASVVVRARESRADGEGRQ
jgi:hypothetical protein